MDDLDKPLSEVFDLAKHPILERKGVAVAFNLISILIVGLFFAERFGLPATGFVDRIDAFQRAIFFGYFVSTLSPLIAILLAIAPLVMIFKLYEWLTQDWLQ